MSIQERRDIYKDNTRESLIVQLASRDQQIEDMHSRIRSLKQYVSMCKCSDRVFDGYVKEPNRGYITGGRK